MMDNMKYTPVEEITYDNIPLTGVLIPGVTVGYVAESKYIDGGYIVVQTQDEMNALTDTSVYTDKVLKNGTTVYVAEEGTTYRYVVQSESNSGSWVVDETADIPNMKSQISDLLTNVSLQSNSISEISSNVSQLQELTQSQSNSISTISDEISSLQENAAQKVDSTVFESSMSNVISNIPTQISQLNNDVGYITNSVSDLTNYYTKTEVDEAIDLESIWDNNRPVDVTVGGILANSILTGYSLKDILSMIFYTTTNPIIIEPTLTIEQKNAVGIVNSNANIDATATFNRGQILLNGVLQNFRAGEADYYTLNGVRGNITVNTSGQITVQPLEATINSIEIGKNEYDVVFHYTQGPQPTNSVGANFETPLPAGTITAQVSITGLTNTWTGNSDDIDGAIVDNIVLNGIITDSSEASKDEVGMFEELTDSGEVIGAGYQFTANASKYSPDYSETYAPVVLIPQGVTITGIQAWDDLQSQWNWYRGDNAEESLAANSWIAGETVEREINHQTITYIVYTYYGILGEPLAFRFFVD